MKTRSRLLLLLVLGVGIFVGLALVLCLEPVDYTPYLRGDYYTETSARLHQEAATNQASAGELFAGFGRARLSPTLGSTRDEPTEGKFRELPLAGYGGRRGRPATGVHDDIFARAIALRVGDRVGVIVGTDLLIVPREVTEAAAGAIERDLRLPRSQLYFGATHSHSSLGGWGQGKVAEGFAGGFQPGVRTWIAGQIVKAVREALSDLRPAACGGGGFQAPDFVRNRLVGKLGQVDAEFSFLLIRQKEARDAVIGSYAAHATVQSGSVMEVGGDYPGYWERAVESATGGLGLFLAGGVGSHSPVPGPGPSGFDAAKRMGEALAERLLEVIAQTPVTNRVAFDTLGLDMRLPPLQTRVTDGLRLRPWLAARLLPVSNRTSLQAFRLNSQVWISTPCDFSGELALGIKDFARARGFHAAVTSFNGDYIGYVIPGRYYHLGGYEPSLMSFYGPNMGDFLDEMVRGLEMAVMEPESPGDQKPQ